MKSRDEIKAAIQKNEAARKRLQKRCEQLNAEWRRLQHELHKAQLAAHIGQPVVTKYRGEHPRFDEAVGILKRVNRTRCVVDFGDRGAWTFPLENIMPEAEREHRGFHVPLGGGT